MTDPWPSNVSVTCEIGSQRGPAYEAPLNSHADVVNAFLTLGWRIINAYIEDKGPDSTREESVVLLGWSSDDPAQYPPGYEN